MKSGSKLAPPIIVTTRQCSNTFGIALTVPKISQAQTITTWDSLGWFGCVWDSMGHKKAGEGTISLRPLDVFMECQSL